MAESRFAVERMKLRDLEEVLDVDRESYSLPWPASAYRRELQQNEQAHYVVLRQLTDSPPPAAEDTEPRRGGWRTLWPWNRVHAPVPNPRGPITGYAGMWITPDEAHVTTIAVRSRLRGQGFGELLLATLVEMAHDIGVRWVTLEVRVSNQVAQNLYRKYGFHEAGTRRRYYSDNNEDAHIMTTDDITTDEYQQRFRALTRRLASRLRDVEGLEVSLPVLGSSSWFDGRSAPQLTRNPQSRGGPRDV